MACIASAAPTLQHAAMREYLAKLMQPLTLALLLTWSAVGLALGGEAGLSLPLAWSLMLAFLVASLLTDLPRLSRAWVYVLLLVQAASALALVWLAPRTGITSVLLVVLAAQLGLMWPLGRTLVAVLLLDAVFLLLILDNGHPAPYLVVMIYGGFQAFALLIGHYASTAEQVRDRLTLVNADLLATRALLADSARDAERLRMARELHDVAGHKLTAMTLNLRALAADPAFAARGEVALAQQLAHELLGDIRGVVQAMRDSRGLDLETAMRALAAGMPRPALQVTVGEDVRITDPAQAEALLRLVQESLTNAARHADADVLRVQLRREGGEICIRVEDDGRLRDTLNEGNGIAGMRERIAALHGSLSLGRTEHGGMCIDARIPA